MLRLFDKNPLICTGLIFYVTASKPDFSLLYIFLCGNILFYLSCFYYYYIFVVDIMTDCFTAVSSLGLLSLEDRMFTANKLILVSLLLS